MGEKKSFANPEIAIHYELAQWASDCAERTLHLFEELHSDDERPRFAIDTLRAWIRNEKTMAECRQAAFSAHDAAREVEEPQAIAAARACGQAAGVAHTYTHCPNVADYAIKAIGLSVSKNEAETAKTAERDWQWDHLRDGLRYIGFPNGKNGSAKIKI